MTRCLYCKKLFTVMTVRSDVYCSCECEDAHRAEMADYDEAEMQETQETTGIYEDKE